MESFLNAYGETLFRFFSGGGQIFLGCVLGIFFLAALAPTLHRYCDRATGWILALAPAGLFFFYFSLLPRIQADGALLQSWTWVPALSLDLAFRIDGLSLLFLLLITGIGALILIYAGGYLQGHPQLGRFYCCLLLFMGAMLGVVSSDNLLALFVFWELTSISSYLLIGFNHEKQEARASALQALLVTFAGGQAMLVGLIFIGMAGGSYSISQLLASPEILRDSALYLPILILILLGAFTKSAQTPFHFWLPGAMAAPTPVSAYLHSATMVTAGVFLLARLHPLLAGTAVWQYTVTGFGLLTMITGAVMAVGQTDLKRLLAYSTVSALGTLTLLLGLGNLLAIQAAAVFLLVHSLYKGSLFMVAGSVDHEVGTRDVTQLGGLARAMPITAAAAGLAALAMCGLPPVLGFIGKELLYEAKLEAGSLAWILVAGGIGANALIFAVAFIVALTPFWGKLRPGSSHVHEAPASLWLGPVVLAALGLFLGLFPVLIDGGLLQAVVTAIHGAEAPLKLKLWHGFNLVLALSGLTIALGLLCFAWREKFRSWRASLAWLNRFGPEQTYKALLGMLVATADEITRLVQHGYLRFYILTILALTTLGIILGLLQAPLGTIWQSLEMPGILEAAICFVMVVAAIAATFAKTRISAAILLSVVGFGVALIFALYSAPDLALTQFLVETLTLILFVIVVYHLPELRSFSSRKAKIRDAILSGIAGLVISLMILNAQSTKIAPSISPWFVENSLQAQGRNIVNVILVDFRALDTLGEITVLALAALGVFGLMRYRFRRKKGGPS